MTAYRYWELDQWGNPRIIDSFTLSTSARDRLRAISIKPSTIDYFAKGQGPSFVTLTDAQFYDTK